MNCQFLIVSLRRQVRLVRAVLFPATTIVLAPSISAQTLGLPITYRGVMTGFGSAIDVGLDPHGFRTFAGTGTVAIGRFAVAGATLPLLDVSATAAIVAGDGFASGWSVGANAALLNSLQIGAGYTRTGSITRLHIPLSAVLPVAACVEAQRAL